MKVYVLECNQLAMKFLLGLLQRGVKATIAPLGADPENSPRKKNEDEQVVLVIDRGALNVPLQVSLRRLSRDFPQAKILVLDGVLSDDEICSLLNLGVDGFVAYNQVINLPRAISAVANGHVWAPLRILEHYVSYIHQLSLATRKSHDELSARETEVLQLLQEKLSNKEISASLEISESTVKFHLVRIFQKFGVHSRYELLATGKLQMEKGRKGFIVQPGQVAIDFDKPDFAGGTVGVDIPLEINSKFSGHFSLNELRTAFDCRSISDGPEKEFLAFVEAVYAQKEGDCRWAESNVSGGTTVKKLGVKGKISASSEPS